MSGWGSWISGIASSAVGEVKQFGQDLVDSVVADEENNEGGTQQQQEQQQQHNTSAAASSPSEGVRSTTSSHAAGDERSVGNERNRSQKTIGATEEYVPREEKKKKKKIGMAAKFMFGLDDVPETAEGAEEENANAAENRKTGSSSSAATTITSTMDESKNKKKRVKKGAFAAEHVDPNATDIPEFQQQQQQQDSPIHSRKGDGNNKQSLRPSHSSRNEESRDRKESTEGARKDYDSNDDEEKSWLAPELRFASEQPKHIFSVGKALLDKSAGFALQFIPDLEETTPVKKQKERAMFEEQLRKEEEEEQQREGERNRKEGKNGDSAVAAATGTSISGVSMMHSKESEGLAGKKRNPLDVLRRSRGEAELWRRNHYKNFILLDSDEKCSKKADAEEEGRREEEGGRREEEEGRREEEEDDWGFFSDTAQYILQPTALGEFDPEDAASEVHEESEWVSQTFVGKHLHTIRTKATLFDSGKGETLPPAQLIEIMPTFPTLMKKCADDMANVVAEEFTKVFVDSVQHSLLSHSANKSNDAGEKERGGTAKLREAITKGFSVGLPVSDWVVKCVGKNRKGGETHSFPPEVLDILEGKTITTTEKQKKVSHNGKADLKFLDKEQEKLFAWISVATMQVCFFALSEMHHAAATFSRLSQECFLDAKRRATQDDQAHRPTKEEVKSVKEMSLKVRGDCYVANANAVTELEECLECVASVMGWGDAIVSLQEKELERKKKQKQQQDGNGKEQTSPNKNNESEKDSKTMHTASTNKQENQEKNEQGWGWKDDEEEEHDDDKKENKAKDPDSNKRTNNDESESTAQQSKDQSEDLVQVLPAQPQAAVAAGSPEEEKSHHQSSQSSRTMVELPSTSCTSSGDQESSSSFVNADAEANGQPQPPPPQSSLQKEDKEEREEHTTTAVAAASNKDVEEEDDEGSKKEKQNNSTHSSLDVKEEEKRKNEEREEGGSGWDLAEEDKE